MKFHSIRSQLIFWIGSLVTLILTLGCFLVYRTAYTTLYNEIDKNLGAVISLQALELEIVDGVIYHEWLLDIEKDEGRKRSEYVQVWNETSGETLRSPALNGQDLPMICNDSYSPEFVSCMLANGHRGRVTGLRVFPVVEGSSEDEGAIKQPHCMSVAFDVEESEQALKWLFGMLIIGLIFSLLVSIVTIRWIVALSFKPLDVLASSIRKIDVQQPKDAFEIPSNLPVELEALTVGYRDLLARIGRVREREREFSGNVAHELRTPLAGIVATLEQALAEDRSASDYEQRIRDTLEVAAKMRGLVNRLMCFSRIYNGTEEVVLTEVDLHYIIESRLAILSGEITQNQLQIRSDLSADSAVIQSDEVLVGILMGNLIGNAVVYAEPKSEISIRTWQTGEHLSFEVSNVTQRLQGIDISRLFEPFYRGDLARTADSDHSGIGLALSREIAQTLGFQLKARLDSDTLFVVQVLFFK